MGLLSRDGSTPLFSCLHGSHLYGTNHAGSDRDTFTVIANQPRERARFAKQVIDGSEDSIVTDLSTFMLYVNKGVPQYCEALFASPEYVSLDFIKHLRQHYRPNYYRTIDTYERTLVNFALKGLENKDGNGVKFLRHAYRLHFNLTDFTHYGRFNPTLTQRQKEQLPCTLKPQDYLQLMPYFERSKTAMSRLEAMTQSR